MTSDDKNTNPEIIDVYLSKNVHQEAGPPAIDGSDAVSEGFVPVNKKLN